MSLCFLKVLNISITAGWLVLAVVVLRLVLKKAPKWACCLLWGLVALRLLLPFTIESRFSLLPSAEPVRTETATVERSVGPRTIPVPYERVVVRSGFAVVDDAVNPVIARTAEDLAKTGTDAVTTIRRLAAWIWIAGVGAMLLYAAVSFLYMKYRVRASIETERDVYVCDDVQSPFIIGVIRPKIFLPSGLDRLSRAHILAHERAHIDRLDHLWKPLGFLLLCIHWFNPLMWVAFVLLSRDIEFACDEKVVSQLDVEGRADYSDTLLAFSRAHRSIAVCPVAFGEVGVKERVRSILRYKQPALWVVLTVLIMGAAVALCFLTAPRSVQAAEAPGGPLLSAPELQRPDIPDRDGADAEAQPESEQATVSMNLIMCVSQQCDEAE